MVEGISCTAEDRPCINLFVVQQLPYTLYLLMRKKTVKTYMAYFLENILLTWAHILENMSIGQRYSKYSQRDSFEVRLKLFLPHHISHRHQ